MTRDGSARIRQGQLKAGSRLAFTYVDVWARWADRRSNQMRRVAAAYEARNAGRPATYGMSRMTHDPIGPRLPRLLFGGSDRRVFHLGAHSLAA